MAQKLHHQTLAASGGVYRSPSLLVSQSIGQLSVNLRGKANNLLVQQGFQQSFNGKTAPFLVAINYGVKVFPNPFQSVVNIQFSETINDDIYVYLYNMFGVLLFKSVQKAPQNLISFDFNEYPTASYILKVSSKKISFSSTLIKL